MAFLRRIVANAGFVLLMLLFVASIAGATAYILQRLRSEAIQDHLEISAMYARVIEDHQTQTINFISLALSKLTQGGGSDLLPARVAGLFAAVLRETPALRSLSLLDGEGRIVASSNPANIGLVVDGRDDLPPHSDERDLLRIGRPWAGRDFADGERIDADEGADTFASFIPVRRELRLGTRKLTLLAALNPDYFINNYGQKLQQDEGYVEVLRYDGVTLLSTDPAARPGRSLQGNLFQKQLPEIEFGSYVETLAKGSELLTSYRASARFPLVVVTHIYPAHALARWYDERRLLLLIVPPALLAVVLLASMLYLRQRRLAQLQAEAAQRKHERLAATVFATVDAAVLVTDQDKLIIEVNPAFTAITGYTLAEVAGRNPRLLFASRQTPEFIDHVYARLQHSGTWRGEVWNRRKNGEDYVAWLSINQVRDEGGRISHHVASFSDITDRKQAEEAQLRAVLEASPDAVILVAADGTIAYANCVCERLFGYTPSELSGLSVGVLVPPAVREAHEGYRNAFYRHPQPRPMASGLHLVTVRRDGSELPVEISLSPIHMGDQLLVIATVSDISQRVRDEAALLRAKDTAEELLGRAKMAERRIVDISEEARERIGQELHDDLGQDLTGVAFLSEVLFQRLRSEARPEMQEAAAITELINKAVSKTRNLAQGLYPVELKEAGLQAMLDQVARNVESIYKVGCRLSFAEDCRIADFVTELNLFRIAQEAINNAVKHSGATQIELQMRRAENGRIFTITDNGCGIKPVGSDAKMRGLGMHIMQYRASLMGATLDIVSVGGQGTRVGISLPGA